MVLLYKSLFSCLLPINMVGIPNKGSSITKLLLFPINNDACDNKVINSI